MFRRHIVVLRDGLRLPEIKFCKASEMSDHRGQMLGSQLLFHRPGLSRERTAVSPCVLLCHQGRRPPDQQQPLPEPHAKWPPVPGQAEGDASAHARWRQRRVLTYHFPSFLRRIPVTLAPPDPLRKLRLSWLNCDLLPVFLIAGLGVHGNLELKMENGEEMSQMSQGHSSDSQRSDEEGEQKAQGENSQGDR